MKIKNILLVVLTSIASSIAAIYVYATFLQNENIVQTENVKDSSMFHLAGSNPYNASELSDFTIAADKSVNSVVHVKTSYMKQTTPTLFDFFFGNNSSPGIQQTPVKASGSGVIISSDGYIVTNNHVIDGTDYIEVVLNDNNVTALCSESIDPSICAKYPKVVPIELEIN